LGEKMVFLSQIGLEYIGEETQINWSQDEGFSSGELTDSLSKRGAKPLTYLLNPFFDSPGLLPLSQHVLILKSASKTATVPDKQGILLTKSTKVVLYKGQFSRGLRHGEGTSIVPTPFSFFSCLLTLKELELSLILIKNISESIKVHGFSLCATDLENLPQIQDLYFMGNGNTIKG
jgi:hypothetical protein